MSDTATVVIEELPEPKTGTNAKGKPWTRYAFKDGNGEIYSTFNKASFDPAASLKGQRAKVTYETEGNFKNIVSIEAVEEAEANGSDPYAKRAEHPSKQRSIHASVALEQAVNTLNHTISKDMTAKGISEKVEPLTHHYYLLLLRLSGTMTDEDLPF